MMNRRRGSVPPPDRVVLPCAWPCRTAVWGQSPNAVSRGRDSHLTALCSVWRGVDRPGPELGVRSSSADRPVVRCRARFSPRLSLSLQYTGRLFSVGNGMARL